MALLDIFCNLINVSAFRYSTSEEDRNCGTHFWIQFCKFLSFDLSIIINWGLNESNPIISKRCNNKNKTKSKFDFAFKNLKFFLSVKEFFVVFRWLLNLFDFHFDLTFVPWILTFRGLLHILLKISYLCTKPKLNQVNLLSENTKNNLIKQARIKVLISWSWLCKLQLLTFLRGRIFNFLIYLWMNWRFWMKKSDCYSI